MRCPSPSETCPMMAISILTGSGALCVNKHMLLERNGLSIKGGLLGNLSVCSIDSSDRSPGNVSAMQNPRPFPRLTQTLHLPKFPDGSVHSKAWKVGPAVFLSGLLRMRNTWVSARRLSLLHAIAGEGIRSLYGSQAFGQCWTSGGSCTGSDSSCSWLRGEMEWREEQVTMLTPTFVPSASSGLPGVALHTKCSQCHLPFFFLVS